MSVGDFSFNSGNRCLLLGLETWINDFYFYFKNQVYGGEARISTLRKLFPLMEDKKSLASVEERAKVEGKASLLAAVDYYVSMQSNIFISASPGNMHNALVSISRNFCEIAFTKTVVRQDYQNHQIMTFWLATCHGRTSGIKGYV